MADDEWFDVEDMTEETRKLLARAGIPESEWAEWYARLKQWGRDALEGDPVALKNLGKLYDRAGLYDKATSIFEQLVDCEEYWVTKNYGIIYYDENANRWRDWDTGRFVRFEPSMVVEGWGYT
jgi:tetratricopeptide (TPR) repeat protein